MVKTPKPIYKAKPKPKLIDLIGHALKFSIIDRAQDQLRVPKTMLKIPGKFRFAVQLQNIWDQDHQHQLPLLTITMASMTNQKKEPSSLQRGSMVLC
jgi:hypothetical protein